MAAIIQFNVHQGVRTYLGSFAIGVGAPVATDPVVKDTVVYPEGSLYYDRTNHILYIREAITGVVGDWFKTAALTVAT